MALVKLRMGPIASCRHRRARLAMTAAMVGSLAWISTAAVVPQPDVESLMAAIGGRVADYYRRAQRVMCVERSTVQPIRSNWSSEGLARTVESELRVEIDAFDGDGLPEATLVRQVRRINGRPPRESDKKNRSGCTDPNPLSPEPLAFLLPGRRDDYRFTSVRMDREQDRAALVVDFRSSNRRSRADLIEDKGGHDDCFDWTGPIATSGRLWVDAQTYDVLKVERHLNGPVDLRIPVTLQRRYGFASWITLDRDDVTLRYEAVPFTDPDEVLLLPSSVDEMIVVRSGLQSTRRRQTYSDYRRFLTQGHVIIGGAH